MIKEELSEFVGGKWIIIIPSEIDEIDFQFYLSKLYQNQPVQIILLLTIL